MSFNSYDIDTPTLNLNVNPLSNMNFSVFDEGIPLLSAQMEGEDMDPTSPSSFSEANTEEAEYSESSDFMLAVPPSALDAFNVPIMNGFPAFAAPSGMRRPKAVKRKSSGGIRKKKNQPEQGSPGSSEEDYDARRAKNNVAVRKCREKQKAKMGDMTEKLRVLSDENSTLRQKIQILQTRTNTLLAVFRSLKVDMSNEMSKLVEFIDSENDP